MPDSNVTFRLRGIPSQYSTKNAVQELVERTLSIHPDTRFDVHSVAANPLEPTSRVATISFQVIPTSLSDRSKKEWVLEPQGDWYSDDIDGWRKPLVFDTHFSGFTPLQSTKQEDCEVDLIALSGLGGHAFGSFKQKNGPFMWLRDALPGDIPTARILIYGYNTTTVQSSSFQNLSDLGRALQTDIREISEPYRPIIFIGHSLGGLVIKQAIAKMSEDRYDQDVSILQSIAAFIFFGVPHQGMAVGSLVPLMGDQPNRALLESLGRNSDLLKRLQRDFDRAFGTEVPKVVSYFETITSPTAIKSEEKARTAQRVYPSDGENVRFRLPEGFRDGAPYTPLRSQGNRLDQTYGQLAMHNDNGWIHFSLEDETSSFTFTEGTKDSSPLPICTHTGNDGIQNNKWPEGEHYEIVPMCAQGMNLSLWRGSHEPGTQVRLYPRKPLRATSLWEIVDAGRGEYHIVSVNSGLYLCAEGFDIRKKIFGDVTGPDKINCRWNILPAGNGCHYITNVDADFYLNVAGSHSHEGSIVILWRPETRPNSQFMFKRAT
ncbi:Agglutinin [Lasiodiplodia theobromae]|uniref:Agglutinin n=1 Tax=Lasiodiplodia theobromae TaxID=45133 RepID=A0A5N5D3T2_9PEZI|nr:Agglutinin [Lasiodiplodia theobromae]